MWAMTLKDHPAVLRYYENKGQDSGAGVREKLDSQWVRQLVLESGADDAGLASIDSPILEHHRAKMLKRRIRVDGPKRLLKAFVRCFPS
jgi:hypothetical protein